MQWIRSVLRRALRPSQAAAIAALLGVAVMGAAYQGKSRQVQRQADREAVLERATLMRSELERVIGADLQLVRGYAAVLALNPGMSTERMSALAAEVVRGSEDLRAIVVAPDLVVSMVYPLEGNAHMLGRDYRTERYRTALGAQETGQRTLAGPIVRSNGDRVFVARTPVYVADGTEPRRFWGLVSLMIDEQALLREIGIGDPAAPLDVALVDADDADRVIAGDPAVLAADPVTAVVKLPSRTWKLSAVPRDGWPPARHLWRARVLFALAGLLIALPILGIGRLLELRQRQLAVIREREAELERLSWRLEFALATSKIGVWAVDLGTGRRIWDDRVKALLGIPAATATLDGSEWRRAVHPDDLRRTDAAIGAAAELGGRFEVDYRVVLPGGAIRHVRDIAAVYTAGDGSRHLVGLIWDVTPEVARSEELDLRRIEAEAATATKSRFLAAMSHEIRTPLGGVLGLLGLMLDDPLPPRQRERASIALASAQGLLEILNDILDFSKLEAQRIRIVEEDVAIRELVRDLTTLMGAVAARKGLALTSAVDPAVPERILADPVRLRQVLTNLVSNATKFTDRGEIRLRVGWDGAAGGTLRVEVEDTGIGIAEEQREAIFRDFVQADGSLARRAGGTGLGLAISRQLVELMGGEIAVRSVPGIGSTFAFHVRARPVEATAAPAAVGPDAGEPPLGPLRVLLAEDHKTNQYLVRAYLRTGGHAVTVAENGAEAVEAARSGRFDVVLMDMQMPVLDGLGAARRIRALGGAAGSVPIIALTANAMPEDRAACLAAGMNDYLAKPVEVAALLAALRRACGAGETELRPAANA